MRDDAQERELPERAQLERDVAAAEDEMLNVGLTDRARFSSSAEIIAATRGTIGPPRSPRARPRAR
jgi:hypothetical protein